MTPGQRAEALISRYGITEPCEIDIEAIALASGIEVEYRSLSGCEATLVGFGGRAIATVKPSLRGRERFSIGHELGHWELHRGKSFRCRIDDPDVNLASNSVEEQQADTFSAHILMPAPLFNPRVNALKQPSFRNLDDLASEFDTSVLATSFRLVDVNRLSVALACYTTSKLKWFRYADDIPRRWWLQKSLDSDSFAYDLFTQGKAHATLGKQSADVWFENNDAENYEVYEACIPGKPGEVLVLLYLEADMMDAQFDPDVGRRYDERGSYVARSRK